MPRKKKAPQQHLGELHSVSLPQGTLQALTPNEPAGIRQWIETSADALPTERPTDTTHKPGQGDTPATQGTLDQGQGDTAPAASPDVDVGSATSRAREPDYMVIGRLTREGRWKDVSPIRDAMVSEARSKGMDIVSARAWTYAELDRLYPPLPPKVEPEPIIPAATDESAAVPGLYLVPEAWPPLADNSSLQAELGWVQSQRLSIVEQRGNSTVVHLERASTPAPSKAALGWLETSIRSYAKYIDIVSRTLSTQVDEQEHTRRERMRIEDIRQLLDEMHRAG